MSNSGLVIDDRCLDGERMSTLCQRAESALRENPHLLNSHLRCRAEDSTLHLFGQVRSYYHKQIAQTIASELKGVEQVVNHIEVDSSN